MTQLEKIEKYIANTTCDAESKYTMLFSECIELAKQSRFEGIALAFQYGKAKGYRAAKAEMKGKKKVEVK